MPNEQKVNRYSISFQDFSKAKDFLAEATKHPLGSLLHEALLFAAIICYYRPFSPNEKDPRAPATSSLKLTDFDPLSPEESEIHERCKELRNKALAHAEFKYHPTEFDPEIGVFTSTVFSLVGKAPDTNHLIRLIETLMEQCRNKKADHAWHNSQNK